MSVSNHGGKITHYSSKDAAIHDKNLTKKLKNCERRWELLRNGDGSSVVDGPAVGAYSLLLQTLTAPATEVSRAREPYISI